MPELEHMAQPALLQACVASSSLPPTLCYYPFFSPFFQAWGCAGSPGCSQRGAGGGGHWQRGAVGVKSHVLHPVALVSAGRGSPAAGRSYSESRSMGKRGGLGDSHGRHVGRRAAGREEHVGFFQEIPPSFPPHPILKGFNDADVFLISFPSRVAV